MLPNPELKNIKFEGRLRQTSKVFAAYVIKVAYNDNNNSRTKSYSEQMAAVQAGLLKIRDNQIFKIQDI